MSSTINLFFTLLLLTSTAITTNAAPAIGIDSFLSNQYRRDTHAKNDSFLYLPSSIKKSLSASDLHDHLPSLLNSILSLSLSFSINVRLIGDFPSDSSSILYSYLSASQPSGHFYVISPSMYQTSRLALKHSLHLDVSHLPSLASRLYDNIKEEISKSPSNVRSPLTSIPHSTVDQIIKQEFDKEKPVEGIYVYLLNLGSQSRSYAYGYSTAESSPAFTKCLGTFWTGKERYIWIDLGAGPLEYGPTISGDGVLPRGEFHPLATMHGRPKAEKALLADLASLIYSAYHTLLVPSLRVPVPFENSLIVQFIHVHGSDDKDSNGLDWKLIEKTFRDEANEQGLLLGDQSLSFKSYEVKYNECSICSLAIWRSMNSYTSRFLFENYTLIANEYLDSKRLHQILFNSGEEFRKLAKVPDEFPARVLPVYVFDLDYQNLLLLDRYHQSVAFKDMVIAVRTVSAHTVSDYRCNGRPIFMRARELERPIIGSILQSMWGVSPTHLLWSPRHNSTLVDYTWSVGLTPFGPFSEALALSFVQKDAARRNVLLTTLNYTIASAVEVFESIRTHGGVRNLLKKNQHAQFVQRWNFFKYKLDKAVSAMSHFDFEMALFYLRSSDHDLYSLHLMVFHASREVEASLVCFKDPPFPWTSVLITAACFLALCYVYVRRDKLFRNKGKRF